MIFENIISFVIGVVLAFSVQRLFGANKEFFKIIESFKRKLPPSRKKAIAGINDKLGMYHIDMSSQKSSIEQRDIDFFLKELEDFDYTNLVFKRKKIERYSMNIQRVINTTQSTQMTVGFLQHFLENKIFENGKPYLFGSRAYKYFKL